MTEVHGLMGRITAAQTLGSAGFGHGTGTGAALPPALGELLGATTIGMGLVPRLGEEVTGKRYNPRMPALYMSVRLAQVGNSWSAWGRTMGRTQSMGFAGLGHGDDEGDDGRMWICTLSPRTQGVLIARG